MSPLCPTCWSPPEECAACEGKGWVDRGFYVVKWKTCTHCHGPGYFCRACEIAVRQIGTPRRRSSMRSDLRETGADIE